MVVKKWQAYKFMQDVVFLVVESEEDHPEEEGGQPDVPRVVEALVGLDAAVGHLDGERNHVDDLEAIL
jgi:hypothetical protein